MRAGSPGARAGPPDAVNVSETASEPQGEPPPGGPGAGAVAGPPRGDAAGRPDGSGAAAGAAGADAAGAPAPLAGAELEAFLAEAGLPPRIMVRAAAAPASETNAYYRADVLGLERASDGAGGGGRLQLRYQFLGDRRPFWLPVDSGRLWRGAYPLEEAAWVNLGKGAWVPKAEVPHAQPAPRPQGQKRAGGGGGDAAAAAAAGGGGVKRAKLEPGAAGELEEEPPGISGWAAEAALMAVGDDGGAAPAHQQQQQQQQQQPQRAHRGHRHAGAAAAAGAAGGAEPMAVDEPPAPATSGGNDVASRDQATAGAPTPAAASPRLLAAADFGPGLEGRQLLILWPEDGRWDAGDVRAVDAATGRATIIYAEAHELEELDLRAAIAAGEVAWPLRAAPQQRGAPGRRSRQPLGAGDIAALAGRGGKDAAAAVGAAGGGKAGGGAAHDEFAAELLMSLAEAAADAPAPPPSAPASGIRRISAGAAAAAAGGAPSRSLPARAAAASGAPGARGGGGGATPGAPSAPLGPAAQKRLAQMAQQFRGVYLMESTAKFKVLFHVPGQNVYLGCFDDAEYAARLHDRASLAIKGVKAATNYPQSSYTAADIRNAANEVRRRYPRMEFRHPAVAGALQRAPSDPNAPASATSGDDSGAAAAAAAAADEDDGGSGGDGGAGGGAPSGGVSQHGRRRRPPATLNDYVDDVSMAAATSASAAKRPPPAGRPSATPGSGGASAAAAAGLPPAAFSARRPSSGGNNGGPPPPAGPPRAPLPPGHEILQLESFGEALIGCSLQLLWPEDGEWYAGRVEDVDEDSGQALIEYERGDDVIASEVDIEELDLLEAIGLGQVAWDPTQMSKQSLLLRGILPDRAERERRRAQQRLAAAAAAAARGAGAGRGGGRARSPLAHVASNGALYGRGGSPPPDGYGYGPRASLDGGGRGRAGAAASAGARMAATAGTKRGSSSAYLGVCRPSSRLTHPKPWMAQLSAGHLGSAWWCFFATEHDAASAYDKVALAVRGVGCATNFGETMYTREDIEWGGAQVRQRNPNVPLSHPWVAHMNPPEDPNAPPDAGGAAPPQAPRASDAGDGGGGGGGRRPSVGGYDGGGDAGAAAAAPGPLSAAAVAAAAAKLPPGSTLLQQVAAAARGLPPPKAGSSAGANPAGGAGGLSALAEQTKLQLALMQAQIQAGMLPVITSPAALQQQIQATAAAVQAAAAARQQAAKAKAAAAAAAAASSPPAAAAAAAAAPAAPAASPPAAPAAGGAQDDDGGPFRGVSLVPSAPPKRRYRAAYTPPGAPAGGAAVWKKSFEAARAAAIVYDCVALAVEGPAAALNFRAADYTVDEVRAAAGLVWRQSPGVVMAHPACAGLAPPAGGGGGGGGGAGEGVKAEASG